MKIEFLKLEAVLTGLTAPTRQTANGRSTARGCTSVLKMPTSRASGTRTARRRRCRRVRVNRSPVARTTTFFSITRWSATASPKRSTSQSRAWWFRKHIPHYKCKPPAINLQRACFHSRNLDFPSHRPRRFTASFTAEPSDDWKQLVRNNFPLTHGLTRPCPSANLIRHSHINIQ